MLLALLPALLFVQGVTAHVAAFHNAMYCRNGLQEAEEINSSEVVKPLYQLLYEQFWMRGDCKRFPPPPGVYLELPAGGSFTVEIAGNRGQTTLANGGQWTTDWPDGGYHPDDMNLSPDCISSPNIHTQNQSMAAGTVFAIAYKSDIFSVTPEDMTVFTVKEHTPWKRVTTYEVPAAMPACPAEGCICSWAWVPNGCGQPNMYQNPFRCMVTGSTSTTPVGKAKPAVWCEGNPDACTKGPKQLISWQQTTGDNIEVEGFDLSGGHRSPGYNTKCGFSPGAQNDIFEGTPQSPPPPVPSTSQNAPPSSEGAPAPTSTSSYIPVNTLPPIDNSTTSTSTSIRSIPSRCARSTLDEAKLVKKSSIASHLKRRRLARRST